MTKPNPFEPPRPIQPIRVEVDVPDDFAELPVKRTAFEGLDVEHGVKRWLFSAAAFQMLSHETQADLIAPTIELAQVVFGDLRRPQQDESFCYAGCPGDYTTGQGIVAGRTGVVSLAFAKRLDDDTILITRFTQRTQESGATGFPVDHIHDFGIVLWRR